MKKFIYFLMVILTFTVFQVATVGADPVLTIGDPVCAMVPPAEGCPPGSPGFKGEPPMCGDVPCPPPGDGAVPMCGDVPCTTGDATSADTETAIRLHAMKTAATCVEAVNEAYDIKRSIHFGTDSPPFPPRGADGKDNERIDAQQEIELEKCQECPTMWSVADKRLETGVAGTHIGSGTVTCLPPAGEAAVAPGAK
jgi:hypothetical protein